MHLKNLPILIFPELQLLGGAWVDLQHHLKISAKEGTGKNNCEESSMLLTDEELPTG